MYLFVLHTADGAKISRTPTTTVRARQARPLWWHAGDQTKASLNNADDQTKASLWLISKGRGITYGRVLYFFMCCMVVGEQ